ncbi:MAG: hypothetical protein ACXU9L_14265 [Thermodesulfobacteriota bacterium]
MKKEVSLILALIFVLLIGTFIFAQAQEDIQKHPSCKYCGMNRKQFAPVYTPYGDRYLQDRFLKPYLGRLLDQ